MSRSLIFLQEDIREIFIVFRELTEAKMSEQFVKIFFLRYVSIINLLQQDIREIFIVFKELTEAKDEQFVEFFLFLKESKLTW